MLLLVAALALATPAQAGLLDKLKGLFGSDKTQEAAAALSDGEIADGLKQALKIGTQKVVGQLGAPDGFWGDEAIRIPLPDTLGKVDRTLNKFGLGGLTDDVKERMNRAAEAATPKARALFLAAIEDMTLEDVHGIWKGPDDAATQYFRARMGPQLMEEMRPVVESSLADVGALKAFDGMIGKYRSLPFVPDVEADLTQHVLEKAMDGIFHYVALEEAAIRKDPLKQSTKLLKKVFGAAAG